VSQWPVVAGTLGAALIVGGLSLVGEHLRARRSERARWLDARRDLAAQFLAATDELLKWATAHGAMMLMRADGGRMTVDGVSTPEEAGKKVADAERAVRLLHTEIDLIGSDEERPAAARLREAVWELASANSQMTANAAEVAQRQVRLTSAGEEHHAAREAFREAARRGLVG
jgi:hypothetical protein